MTDFIKNGLTMAKNNLKCLFLSKDNLATNPRIKKEIDLALERGCDVTFVGFKLGNWADDLEKEILVRFSQIKTKYLSASRGRKSLLWLISSIIEKILRIIYVFKKDSVFLAALSHSKRTVELMWFLFWHRKNYDLVIAHTLPTLYPGLYYAKKTGAKFVFDVEDYHPGEAIEVGVKREKARRELLLKELLPRVDALTYASPLIGEYIELLVDTVPRVRAFIANSFPEEYFEYEQNDSEKIEFVWFSQNIGPRRGLELLIPSLWEYRDKVRITLIGNLYNDFWEGFLKQYKEVIKILPPMSERLLYRVLCKYDIGCAIELDEVDLNRQICLTNKIYAYAQAGLFIFATNTKAQSWFLQQHNELGILVMQFLNDFKRKIEFIIENIEDIRSRKRFRFEYAKQLSWDHEKDKVWGIWNKILGKEKS